jgi:uncharacterized protein involved in exopolysaccharide biosynthesis
VSSSRRSPNFPRFILTGAILGFALGGLIAITGTLEGRSPDYPATYRYSQTQAIMYLGLLGALLFGLVAAVIAILLDRRG